MGSGPDIVKVYLPTRSRCTLILDGERVVLSSMVVDIQEDMSILVTAWTEEAGYADN